ncbi:hypothetical protein WME75_20985 [Sorangium sp. So ce1014]|uniref:imine reductase family protein n=1 Tax=Sorangium sp. So ce1014 TaxID=3133326 RepID=UPI003F5FEB00
MAGTVSYLGEKVGSASALDLAFISFVFAALIGFYHGARICEAEGLRVGDFGSMPADVAPAVGAMSKQDGHALQARRYVSAESSVEMCARGAEIVLRQAREARIDVVIPAFATGLFRKGVAAGAPSLRARSSRCCARVLREGAARENLS